MNIKTKLLIGGAVLAAGATTYVVVKNVKKKKEEKNQDIKKEEPAKLEASKEEVIESNVGNDTIIKNVVDETKPVEEKESSKDKEEVMIDEAIIAESKKVAEEVITEVCNESGVKNLEELIEKTLEEETSANEEKSKQAPSDEQTENAELSVAEIIDELDNKTVSVNKETAINNMVENTEVSKQLDEIAKDTEYYENPEVIEDDVQLEEVRKRYSKTNKRKNVKNKKKRR